MKEESGALFFLPSFLRAEKTFGAVVVVVTNAGRGDVDANESVVPIAAPLGTNVTEGFGAE
jgi:hypothetical protein